CETRRLVHRSQSRPAMRPGHEGEVVRSEPADHCRLPRPAVSSTAARGPDMEKLAALNGEVVTIAVDPARGRVVACTSDCNAAVLEHDEPSEDSASLVRSALEGMKADWSPDLHAAFIAGRLYLTFGSFELKGGGHSALLVVDLDAGTTAEVHRDADGFYTGRVSPPVGVDDRFVLVETFDGEASKLVAFELPGLKRWDVLRLEIQDAELGLVRPVVAAMALVPAGRRLYLVTTDPDNC